MKSLLKWGIRLKGGFMQLVDTSYIKKKTEKREGKCRKCGKCCGNCRFLDKKTRLCKVYGNRPRILCYREFPLSKTDQKVWEVENCGYRFRE
jgi:Fe-S-cluster containining protein